jgi:hypothetical protein
MVAMTTATYFRCVHCLVYCTINTVAWADQRPLLFGPLDTYGETGICLACYAAAGTREQREAITEATEALSHEQKPEETAQ